MIGRPASSRMFASQVVSPEKLTDFSDKITRKDKKMGSKITSI